jgi:hypothetical protein
MISLVDVLKDRVERMRGRLSTQGRYQADAIFYHSCRVMAGDGDQPQKYRVTMLVRAANCVEAEKIAEGQLQEILTKDSQKFGDDVSVRWLKGRLLSNRPNEDESETTLGLLRRLRRGSAAVESAVERIEVPPPIRLGEAS